MICSSHELKSNYCSVSFSIFTDYVARRANGVASEWSHKNQNLSYQRVNFCKILIKGEDV